MAKLTRKSYKRRRLVTGIALFMSIALISTGFAAFVIASQSSDNTTGDVQVGTVDNKSLKVTIDTTKSKLGNFSFDADKDDVSGRMKASTEEGATFENLSIKVVGNIDHSQFLGKLTAQLIRLDTNGDEIKTLPENDPITKAVADKYITAPACYYNEVTLYDSTKPTETVSGFTYTPASGNEKAEFAYVVSFAWGEKFGTVNPSIYYDNAGKDIEDNVMIQTMVDFRNLVYGISETYEPETGVITQDKNLPGLKYKLIITATPN